MYKKKIVVIIPARYASSRFPGKPLTLIAGKSMLERVYNIACTATAAMPFAAVIISTEDKRIKAHAESFGATVVMTNERCRTGSDRALNACAQLDYIPDIVINLQGDTPLTPPHFIKAIIDTLVNNEDIDVATPVTQLSWQALDLLRLQKKQAPFSGTTVITDKQGLALWFSKQIIPAMRNEPQLRASQTLSPIYRHIGLYGYKFNALKQFIRLGSGYYEALEGLEQLRLLEHGMSIKTVRVEYGDYPAMSGVDTPADAALAEKLILKHGDSSHA